VMLESSQCPIVVPFTNPGPIANQSAYGPPFMDTSCVSRGNGGVMTSTKYYPGNARAGTSATQLRNESAYAGIGTSDYSSITGSHHTVYSGQEAGRVFAPFHSPPLTGVAKPGHRDRTTIRSNNQKAQFGRVSYASNGAQPVPVPYPPLMVSPPVEEDSGIRIPIVSPPLYTPL
jgi:hypothetical protein